MLSADLAYDALQMRSGRSRPDRSLTRVPTGRHTNKRARLFLHISSGASENLDVTIRRVAAFGMEGCGARACLTDRNFWFRCRSLILINSKNRRLTAFRTSAPPLSHFNSAEAAKAAVSVPVTA